MEPQVVDRAKRLFQFLARVQELKARPVRSVAQYRPVGDPIWFHALPSHPAVRISIANESDDLLLLTVGRVIASSPPDAPAELLRWIDGGSTSSPTRRPTLRQVRDDGDGSQIDEPPSSGTGSRADPEITSAFDSWIGSWDDWAARERADQPVRELYERLFRFHAATEGRAEELELLLGVGLLSWSPTHAESVERHVCTTPVTTSIDDVTGEISVHIDDSAIGLRVELDMLEPTVQPPRHVLDEFEKGASAFGDHPLVEASFGDLARMLVHNLAADGTYRPDWQPSEPTSRATISFAPTIILRNRSQLGMQSLLQRIAEQIEEAATVPAGLLPLVDPGRPPQPPDHPGPGALLELDEEVYSPLPLNEVQRKIIERTDQHAQVLVQGPPGTGKTHTAAALLSHLLAQGRRVLVTAQTDRALEEVRNKLPEQIKPLAVSVIGASRSDMADLKLAVDTISRRASDYDPDESRTAVARSLETVEQLRRERRQLGRALLEAREYEVESRDTLGYRGTPAALARQFESESGRHGWIRDFVFTKVGEACPLQDSEALRWLALLRDNELELARDESRKRTLTMEELLTPEQFASSLAAQTLAENVLSHHASAREHPHAATVARLSPSSRASLRQHMTDAMRDIHGISSIRLQWIQLALRDIALRQGQVWRHRRADIGTALHDADQHLRNIRPGTPVEIRGEHGPALQLAQHLLQFVRSRPLKTNPDGSPKAGALAPREVRQARPLFETARVGGLPPTSPEQLVTVMAYIYASRALDHADHLWPVGADIPAEDTLQERMAWHVAQVATLDRILNLEQQLEAADRAFVEAGLPQPVWSDAASLESFVRLVDAEEAADQAAAASQPVEDMHSRLATALQWGDASDAIHALAQALDERSPSMYARAYERWSDLERLRSELAERLELGGRLRAAAPPLCEAIERDVDDPLWDLRLADLNAAWRWRELGAIIASEEGVDVNVLQAQLNDVETRLREQAEHLAAARAWSHAVGPSRLTLAERPKLTHYSQLVAKLGKGTGKYAARRRVEIRQAMDRCRPLVPVWIMPLYRIAEQLEIRENLFDVVLIDEASQAGTEAVFLQYLARTIIVIGDDKQVSPTAVGLDQEQVRRLASQFLYDDDYRSAWSDPKRSLFDEAKMRFGGQLTLIEHRRCVPEIIGFSNRIAYGPEGIRLVPVRQYGADRLSPIKLVHCIEGIEAGPTGSKVNHSEAEAIVDQILACIEDPSYDGKTFGVISLVGSRQAQLIEGLLLQRVPAEEWSARALRCGDSAAFQGSERDVVFLSMVSGPDNGGYVRSALTAEMYVQRFNVAVSRARDQMWLFHSVDLTQLRNPEDMRYQLLEYCQQQLAGATVAGWLSEHVPDAERVAPFDSLFEQRVYNLIVDRGYRVEPQVEVNGYRIDLVVIGAHARAAVECDGDAWHGPEAYARDLSRQRDLERCGWQFFRVRESSFYVDRPAALDGLWELLDGMGIRPVGTDDFTDAEDAAVAELEYASERVATTAQTTEAPQTTDELEEEGIPESGAELETLDEHPSDTSLAPAEAIESQLTRPQEAPGLDGVVLGDEILEDELSSSDEDDGDLWPDSAVPEFASTSPLAPYHAFEGTTPHVEEVGLDVVLDWIVQIVATEQPVIGGRIHQVYITSSGDHRVGKRRATILNRALMRAVRLGRIEGSDPLNRSGLRFRTFRLPEVRDAPPRVLGPLRLEQMPPDELARVVELARQKDPAASDIELFRKSLAMLGRTRLTTQAVEVFEEIKPLLPALDLAAHDSAPDSIASVANTPAQDENEGESDGEATRSATALAREFHRDMVELQRRAATEANYHATVFGRMLAEIGGLATARQILAAPTVSHGFTELWERGRLDLTIESLVLQERYADLFAETELDRARVRLADHGDVRAVVQAPADGARTTPADHPIVTQLLESRAYDESRARAGARVVSDDVVRRILNGLLSSGGRATQDQLVRDAESTTTAATAVLAAVRRVINLDGYEVISIEGDTRMVRLDVGLLREQFDLDDR